MAEKKEEKQMSFMESFVKAALRDKTAQQTQLPKDRKEALDTAVEKVCTELGFTKNPLNSLCVPIRTDGKIYRELSWMLVRTCGSSWEKYLAEALALEGIKIEYVPGGSHMTFIYSPKNNQ